MGDEVIDNLITIALLSIFPICMGIAVLLTWIGIRGDRKRQEKEKRNKGEAHGSIE